MSYTTFANSLRTRRAELGLTQSQVANLCSLPLTRLVFLERGVCQPDPTERSRLGNALHCEFLDWDALPRYSPPGPQVRPWDASHGLHNCLALLKSKDTDEAELIRAIHARPDFRDVHTHLQHLPLGSAARNEVVLNLLAKGALPRLLVPKKLGPIRFPLLDCVTGERVEDRHHYALQLADQAYFFGVAMRVPEGIAMPDMLVHNGKWTARFAESQVRAAA